MNKLRKIAIAGGTGLIGKNVSRSLRAGGYNCSALSSKKQDWDSFRDQATQYDVFVNLSGKNILKNPFLTQSEKKALIDSRVGPTQEFIKALQQKKKSSGEGSTNSRPVLIVASAVGYYPTSNGSDKNPLPEVDEYSQPTNNFIGQLCQTIEAAADGASNDARVVKLRFPVVLANDGGLFPNQALQYKCFLGGRMGTGKQGFPWVHIDDVVQMVNYAIENEQMEGVYNVVAPDFVTQDQYSKLLAQKLNRFAWFNVPEFIFRLFFGERAPLLVEGSRVHAVRTKESGFTWKFPTLGAAFDALLGRKSSA
eukprot:TRINITY_DN2550_c0_g1_i1.p1 TRINITY_DN2550_c0_g1~~TRINITY_DN2550_c0_g1_i1.p1  ORF type:complete len:309 (+),score=72.20 TRINITY_DN2550_c0_g1_i1:61-987(+)